MSKLNTLSARNMYPNAYKLFDELRLFVQKRCGFELPDVMLDLHTVKKDAHGWFRNRSVNDGWVSLGGQDILEIGLNPAGRIVESEAEANQLKAKGYAIVANDDDWTAHRPTRDIVATLLHEICHLADHVKNDTKRQDNHSDSWKLLMTKCGLQPVSCEPHKERTNKWTHEIIPGGVFEEWYEKSKVISEGFEMEWRKNPKRARTSASNGSSKFVCPGCGSSLRGSVEKLSQMPICGICSSPELGLIYYNETTADGTFIDHNKLKAVNA